MTFLRHLLMAAAYTVIAAAVAIALPQTVPSIDVPLSIAIGAVVLLACALLHEVFTRQEDHGKIVDELYDMRLTASHVMKEIRAANADAARIARDIASTAERASKQTQLEDEVRELRAELKMLETLVGGFTPTARPAASVAPIGEPRPARRTNAPDDAAILAALQEAIKSDNVEIALQPIVSLPQRRIRFYEGFTRIRSTGTQLYLPGQYVAIAEREKLIPAIDNVLLFRTVQLLRKMHKKHRSMAFFCNISPHSLTDQRFIKGFIEFMNQNAELAPHLVFEFSQSILASRDSEIESHLGRLGAMGFRFSMDQVANLRLDIAGLAERGFRYVKIGHDRLLAEQANPTMEVTIQDIKRTMARHGIQLIAEKIESEAKLLEVLDLDVDYGHGYLFGEPQLDIQPAAA